MRPFLYSLFIIISLYLCSCSSDTPSIPHEDITFDGYFLSSNGNINLLEDIELDTIFNKKNIIGFKLKKSIYNIKVYLNEQYNQTATYAEQNCLIVHEDSLGGYSITFDIPIDKYEFNDKIFDININFRCKEIFADTVFHRISVPCKKFNNSVNSFSSPMSASLDNKNGSSNSIVNSWDYLTVKFTLDRD